MPRALGPGDLECGLNPPVSSRTPSLHSNSPLDVSIKGQMIRDLLNLAGFVLPSTEELLSSSSSGSSSSSLRCFSRPAPL